MNKEARKDLRNICHVRGGTLADCYGKNHLVSSSSIDNFAQRHNLQCGTKTENLDYADWEKIEKACNCEMIFIEDSLDYMYTVRFKK